MGRHKYALIAGLRLAKSTRAKHLSVISESQLIVNQVNQEYQARNDRMALAMLVQIINESSLTELEIMDNDQPDTRDWRSPIRKHLETGALLEVQADARRVQTQATHYFLRDGVLYKRG